MKTPEKWLSLIHDTELSAGLYLAATPIGNLGDITLRVLNLLLHADQIWAEDTRNLRKLLNLYEIPVNSRPLLACHDHNEANMVEKMVQSIKDGQIIAYVSDAGMPVVSDPGYRLIAGAHEADVPFTVLPGASAVLSALVLSGAPSDQFGFYGFIPNKAEKRAQFFDSLKTSGTTALAFESANRVDKSLEAAQSVFGEAGQVAIVREITKTFEEVIRGTIAEVIAAVDAQAVRGEVVMVFWPNVLDLETEEHISAKLEELMKTMRINDAVKAVANQTGWSRNDVYTLALAHKNT